MGCSITEEADRSTSDGDGCPVEVSGEVRGGEMGGWGNAKLLDGRPIGTDGKVGPIVWSLFVKTILTGRVPPSPVRVSGVEPSTKRGRQPLMLGVGW